MGPTAPPDIPVVVHGHTTDPTKDGYQILYNYESTYWRAVVGSPAWALYEVLRSFCHKQNNICYPSVNLLLDILGIKERRVYRLEEVINGKEYRYPGLIEILYDQKPVVAQVEGEGPKMRNCLPRQPHAELAHGRAIQSDFPTPEKKARRTDRKV